MREPEFAFAIPSLEDDLPLDCRIYNGSLLNDGRKGVIVSHPYPPLGGSQDDPVVLSLVDSLLKEDYVVATFNFRGAGESSGKTSWTGRPEIEDYSSVIGLLVYYLRYLISPDELNNSPVLAAKPTVHLLLGGYSFGSLVLARLGPVAKILARFELAERGTAAAEIVLRATTLARQSSVMSRQRGQPLGSNGTPTSPHSQVSPITMGGEETNPSERRSSHDKRRSMDIVREVPHRLRTHMRRHSGSSHKDGEVSRQGPTTSIDSTQSAALDVRYLLISPVLIPLTPYLLSPGLPLTTEHDASSSGLLSLHHPTLILFGTSDSFTPAKRLRQWAEKLERESSGRLRWTQIDGAGHFWREKGVLQAMEGRVTEWLSSLGSPELCSP